MSCKCLKRYETFLRNKYTIEEVGKIIAIDLLTKIKSSKKINEVQRINFLKNILKYNWPQIAKVINEEFFQDKTGDAWRKWYNRRIDK